jgi:Domain of unknown function (DUF4189)
MIPLIKCAIAALLFAILVSPNAAQAQATYPCPFGGPSPGHRVVGQTPAGNGVGSVLLCVPDGTEQSAPPQQPQGPPPSYSRSSRYGAVAVHPNANDVWAITDAINDEIAKKRVLEYCSELMGAGCEISMSVQNASIAVARANNGTLISDWGETPKKASQKMMAGCMAAGLRCKMVKSFTTTAGFAFDGVAPVDLSRLYLPKLVNIEDINNIFGAAAWMEKGDDSVAGGTVWISGGQTNMADAKKAAIYACESASKTKCAISSVVANGFITVGRVAENTIITTVDQSASDAEKGMNATCKIKKLKCKRVEIVDIKKAGVRAIETRLADQTK